MKTYIKLFQMLYAKPGELEKTLLNELNECGLVFGDDFQEKFIISTKILSKEDLPIKEFDGF